MLSKRQHKLSHQAFHMSLLPLMLVVCSAVLFDMPNASVPRQHSPESLLEFGTDSLGPKDGLAGQANTRAWGLL